jgi:hypothetical protein
LAVLACRPRVAQRCLEAEGVAISKVIRHPDRYVDEEKGAQMFSTVMRLIEEVEAEELESSDGREEAA